MKSTVYIFCFLLAINLVAFGQNPRAHRYMQLLEYQDAADAFESHLKSLSVSDLVDYANVLYHSRSYDKALSAFNKALEDGASLNESSKRNYRHCKSIDKDEMQVLDEEVSYFRYSPYAQINVESACMNSENEDVSPFYWQGNLFVASSRMDVSNRKEGRYAFTNLPFLKVVVLAEECDSTSSNLNLPIDLNGKFHSGPITISNDGQHLVATRNYAEPNENNNVNLYLLHFVKTEEGWTNGRALPFCQPGYSVQHAMFDSTGQTIYFSSNMPSSFGGFDLYTSTWNGQEWSEPIHLGDSVNSIYDEVFPFFSPSGLFGYSTNHIEGYGGLDLALFYGGKRFLLSPPLNSVYDEYGLTFKTDSIAYFSSNRMDGSFNDDIFRVSPVLVLENEAEDENMEMPFVVDSADTPSMIAMIGDSVNSRALPEIASTQNADENVEFALGATSLGGSQRSASDIADQRGSEPPNANHESNNGVVEVMAGVPVVTAKPAATEHNPVLITPSYDSWSVTLYFDHDRPARSEHTSYDELYESYVLKSEKYQVNSQNSNREIVEFFEDLEGNFSALDSILRSGADAHVAAENLVFILSSYCSPVGSQSYNISLAERRNRSVQQYIMQWNNGYYRDAQFESTSYGEPERSGGLDVDDVRTSVYGVEASKWRHTSVKIEVR